MVANTEWIKRSRTGRPPLEERILDLTGLGDALFQEQVSRTIAVCHKRMVGAQSALNFIPWEGDAYHVNQETPGPDALWVDDTDDLDCAYPDANADEDDYAKVSFAFTSMLVKGNVTRQAIVRGRSFVDILARQLMGLAERATYALEKAIFRGNFAGGTKEFDGLFTLINAYPVQSSTTERQVIPAYGVVLSTTPASTTLGVLTLTLLDTLLDELKAGPAVIFVSRLGRRIIRGLLQDQVRYNDKTVVRGGFEVEAYFDAGIVATDGIPDTLLIKADGSGDPVIHALTGGTSTAVVAVNTDEVFIAEWTPLTVEPMDKCTSQRQKFEGYWDGVLVRECPQGAAMIIGIDKTQGE